MAVHSGVKNVIPPNHTWFGLSVISRSRNLKKSYSGVIKWCLPISVGVYKWCLTISAALAQVVGATRIYGVPDTCSKH